MPRNVSVINVSRQASTPGGRVIPGSHCPLRPGTLYGAPAGRACPHDVPHPRGRALLPGPHLHI
jgi:hypothetical protein